MSRFEESVSDVIRETGARCRNWGKWGPDDERGTLNYITPDHIVRAARLVKRGAVFSLAIPFNAKGPQINQPRRFNPIHRMMITGPDCTTGAIRFPGGVGFSDDMVIMPLQCATQWDALGHCFEDGRMYNGYDANEVSSRGAKRNGIDKVAQSPGGIVVRPNEIPDSFQPLHQVCIPNMGLTIGEIFFLDDLAADCAGDGVYEFLFVAPPLPITGAVGSPINPLAIK